MNARADATLAAIVRELAWQDATELFWVSNLRRMRAPGNLFARPLTVETIQRHLRRAGYAVATREHVDGERGIWRLTPAGLAAVEAARAGDLSPYKDAAEESEARATPDGPGGGT